MWFHQNPPPPSVTPENHMIPPKSPLLPHPLPLKTMWSPKILRPPLHYPWKPHDSHKILRLHPSLPLKTVWFLFSKSSAPLSVTPKNNAIPQNPPPPFITPKNHMTPTKSSASILRCRWKPCDPLKSSVPPLLGDLSKSSRTNYFPTIQLDWGMRWCLRIVYIRAHVRILG